MMTKWLAPALVAAALLYLARAVLPPFIIAAVLAYIFSPVVDQLERRTRLPRLAVVGSLYAVLLTGLGFTLWAVEARLVREARALSEAGPNLVTAAFVRLLGGERLQVLGQPVDPYLLADWTNRRIDDLLGSPSDAFQLAERAIDTVLKTLLTLLALFYLLLDGRRIGPYLLRFVGPGQRAHIEDVADRIHRVLGRYLRGQLLLIALVSGVTYVVLAFVFRLPFALAIAIASGVLEVIPLLGPVLAGAIASLVALAHGGFGMMIGVVVAYFILRQAEDQLVMPIVVGRAVHLHPLVPILAVLVGGTAAGVLGAILAVPVAAALRVTLDCMFPEPGSATPAESCPAPGE